MKGQRRLTILLQKLTLTTSYLNNTEKVEYLGDFQNCK